MSTRLSDDERMLLKALAAAPQPIGLEEVMRQLLPPLPDGSEWYGQTWWGRQWCATAKNWIDLRRAGMFEPVLEVTDGFPGGFGYALTDMGWAALREEGAGRA